MLLDGGLSTALEAAGYDLNHPLWSAHLLAEQPQALVQAHLAYLNAGARCLTTASYQASLPGFWAAGYSLPQAESLTRRSLEVAHRAIARYREQPGAAAQRPIAVAASLGPYGAYLADGSEYRGNYGVADEELRAFHRWRIATLEAADIPFDYFACETLPDFREAQLLAEEISNNGTRPAWFSFSCQDERRLHDGTPLADVVRALEPYAAIFAVGVNCTAPKYVLPLIEEMRRTGTTKQLIVYPNSGEIYNPAIKQWHGLADPHRFADQALRWRAAGAAWVGGCCRVGPRHIAALAAAL